MEYRYRPMRHFPTSTTVFCTTRGSFISAANSNSVQKSVNREICVSCVSVAFCEISYFGVKPIRGSVAFLASRARLCFDLRHLGLIVPALVSWPRAFIMNVVTADEVA